MGAEREDTDPNPKRRAGTEPGLGRPSSGQTPAATVQAEDEGPPPVDFDALHAALGDPLDYDELPSGPAVEEGLDEPDDLLDNLATAPGKVRGGESSGRSSATYASSRPHTIPPTRAPNEDLNAPPVIVASDDTVPSAPPQMTVPLITPGQPPVGAAFRGGPIPTPGPVPVNAPGSGPHLGYPSSGAHPSAPAFLGTPPPMPALPRGMHQMTMRMPDRPVPVGAINPRRQKTETLVVRARGPSMKQKLVAFMAMLLLFTACGIAMIIWRKPRWLGLDPSPIGSSGSATVAPSAGTLAPEQSASTASTMTPPSPSSAAPSSSPSAKKPAVAPKPAPPLTLPR